MGFSVSTILAFIFFVTIANGVASTDLPRLPLPRYNTDGSVNFSPRIVGGTPALLGEFRGIVSLQNRNGNHFCGGTIIDATHIVTAAHCVTNDRGQVASPTAIQAQADDLRVPPQPSANTRQIRLASFIFVHTSYNIATLQNDIAVIRVSQPFNLTNTFNNVTRSGGTPPDNSVCSVAGWGVTSENSTTGSPNLLRIDVNVINTAICNQNFSYGGLVRPGMICAGFMAGGRDSCQGDSGGGLICQNYLAGVVSFGYGCARPNFPGVYTDISHHNAFIDSAIRWTGGSQSQIPTPTTVRPSSSTTIVISTYMFVLTIWLIIFMK